MKNGNVINIDKEIDWELYKGKDNNKAKKGYIGFWNEIIKAKYMQLSPYVNARTKVLVKCDKGHEHLVRQDHFKAGHRCPKCYKEMMEIVELDFKRELKEDGYTQLSPYVNARTKVLVRCDKGHEYFVTPSDFKTGRRCKVCAGFDKKTVELDFKRELKEDGYTQLSPYVNVMTHVLVRCDKGHEYFVTPANFKNNKTRCPHCKNQSKGERITEKLLKEARIDFKPQMKFDEMRDKQKLSYDFYLTESKIAIEIQGIQHYEPRELFGGEERFKVQKRHDQIKRNYAKANGIKLIEIPYYGRKYNVKYVEEEVKRIIEEVRIFITETESKQLKFIF